MQIEKKCSVLCFCTQIRDSNEVRFDTFTMSALLVCIYFKILIFIIGTIAIMKSILAVTNEK